MAEAMEYTRGGVDEPDTRGKTMVLHSVVQDNIYNGRSTGCPAQ